MKYTDRIGFIKSNEIKKNAGMAMRHLSTLAIFSAIMLSGCTPNMTSKTDLKLTSFSTKVTTKKDVIAVLGLPERIARNSDGTEALFYSGDANLTGFLVANRTSSVQFLAPTPVDEVIGNRKVGDGALYLFDKEGYLIFEDSPRTRSEKQ